MTAKIYKYFFLLGTAITIFVNYLAISLPINNVTTEQVSNQFYTILTPAGFTFAIWGIIYLGLVVLGLLIATDNYKISRKGVNYFLLSCLTNCLWLFSWHNFELFLGTILLLLLVFFNYKTYSELEKSSADFTKKTIVTSWYLIYLGWSIVASIINITTFLKYDLDFTYLSLETQGIWGSIILFVAFVINYLFSLKKRNVTLLLVFLWSLVGISVSQSSNDTLILSINIIYGLIIIGVIQILFNRFRHKAK